MISCSARSIQDRIIHEGYKRMEIYSYRNNSPADSNPILLLETYKDSLVLMGSTYIFNGNKIHFPKRQTN
jgi:hypothetical protein